MSTQSTDAQVSRRLLMIRPACFGHNAETAASNAFQAPPDANAEPSAAIQARALAEFDGLVALLRERGVEVCVVEDDPQTDTPDALFPNNWVSFHSDGTVVLYPMQAENRRLERRDEVIDEVCKQLSVAALRTVRMADEHESQGSFLEGTGSLILDRPRRVAYACLSPRTHPDVLEDFSDRMGYEVREFRAFDETGQAVYHTNVVMTLGEGFCVLCTEAITDDTERYELVAELKAGNRELVEISHAQVRELAGNLLHVANAAGERFIVGSTRAFASLDADQRAVLERYGELLGAPLDTIETVGGGGARCMLAEVFLPPQHDGTLPA